MDVITETSLEALLQRATDYRNKKTDTAAIDAFCGIIKKETDGPLIASRLIAAKIQSPEEWEALQGLTVLETCMKNCGSPFHSEIGKFRFLNEMIKLVSPKFLGPRTAESVRNQVLKLMHDWTFNYPKEHKIKEAYEMLIKQGVVQNEEVSLEGHSKSNLLDIQSKANPIFQDEEKVRLLQKLLHSKKPDDLQAANRLIKTMVREDEKRIEIKSKRISEVETIRNNVRLLSEMLESYRPNSSSSDELDLIKELQQGCERLKPNIMRLASEVQDNDEFLNQVLSVDDELEQVLVKYKDVISKEKVINDVSEGGGDWKQVSALLDLSTPMEDLVPLSLETSNNYVDILGQPVLNSDVNQENTSFKSHKNETAISTLDQVFSSLDNQNCTAGVNDHTTIQQVVNNSIPAEKSKKMKAFEELDILGETLLQQCKVNAISKKENNEQPSCNESESEIEKPSDITLVQTEAHSHSDDDLLINAACGGEAVNNQNSKHSNTELNSAENVEVRSLTDLFVPLESIRPSLIPPVNVIEEKNGISVTIHVAQDKPREDVGVFVVTTLSKNPCPVTNYLFQAVVPKGCKVKLQSPSGSDLPGHNPFLPPSALTQIMLIANPYNVDVTLKCMISYVMKDETFTEMGEVEKLNSSITS